MYTQLYKYIYIYIYIYSAIKNNESFPFAAKCVDLEGIRVSEISQTEKDKYCMLSHMCNLKKYKKLVNITEKKETLRHRTN